MRTSAEPGGALAPSENARGTDAGSRVVLCWAYLAGLRSHIERMLEGIVEPELDLCDSSRTGFHQADTPVINLVFQGSGISHERNLQDQLALRLVLLVVALIDLDCDGESVPAPRFV
jgi:hypothetical protein